MDTAKTCGNTRPNWDDDPCRRLKGHNGKHHGRWALWPQKRKPRRRYVPPHQRPEGAPDLSSRGYERPSDDANPKPENLTFSANTTEG